MDDKNKFENLVIRAVLGLGALFSVAQFLYNRSLWLDEAILAMSIIHRNPVELLRPLDYFSVAPILFLQLSKIFSYVIPNSELGLRLLPIMEFLLSLLLFYKILDRIFRNKYAVILGLSLFAFNPPLIFYASEFKQYMGDVFVILLVYYLLLLDDLDEKRRYRFLAVAGVIGVFLSNVAPIILLTAGTYLLYRNVFEKKENFRALALVSGTWALSFAIYFYFFIYNHPSRDAMIAYWQPLNVFLPRNTAAFAFMQEKFFMVKAALFQFGPATWDPLILFFCVGAVSLMLRKRFDYLILAGLPMIVHLGLSSFKMYPVDVRLVLYTVPLFIFVIAWGISEILDLLFRDLKIESIKVLAIYIPLWLCNAAYVNRFYNIEFPYKREEIKKSWTFIEQNKIAGDKIILNDAATHAYTYYVLTNRFKPEEELVRVGTTPFEGDAYAEEIGQLHGGYWFLFSHPGNEEKLILDRLSALGIKKTAEYRTIGSSAYRFESAPPQ